MDEESFCYWLNGFVELVAPTTITQGQWAMIKDHLALVMKKVTPEVKIGPPVTGPVVPVDYDWSKYLGNIKPLRHGQGNRPQPFWLTDVQFDPMKTPIC